MEALGETEWAFGRGVEESDISVAICNGAVPCFAGETQQAWVWKFTKKEDYYYSFATEVSVEVHEKGRLLICNRKSKHDP